MREIYANLEHPWEERVAVVEEGRLVEVLIERKGYHKLRGNIFKGRVVSIRQEMDAAFVDIGLDKNAFLFLGELKARKHIEDFDEEEWEEYVEETGRFLRLGEEVLVQVVREATELKGPRVTMNMAIPSHYLVLLPNRNKIAISRKIENSEDRERLKKLVENIKPPHCGVIVRTEAKEATEEEIKRDMNFLVRLWHGIKKRAERTHAPALIHQEAGLLKTILRDLITRDVTKIVVDSRSAYRQMRAWLENHLPYMKDVLELYQGDTDLFQSVGIEDEIWKALDNRVDLKNGAFLIIEETEALTAIDVNSGAFWGGKNFEDSIFKLNIEAVDEVVRQIRLRNLSGIIVVDFVDMKKEEHRQQVVEKLKEKLRRDRIKSVVFGMTSLGLVEISRKKTAPSLSQILEEKCPVCGKGRRISSETLLNHFYRQIFPMAKAGGGELRVVVSGEVLEEWQGRFPDRVKYISEKLGRKIVLVPSALEYGEFKVFY